jgi:cytochrome c-type biogenesis protein CcmH
MNACDSTGMPGMQNLRATLAMLVLALMLSVTPNSVTHAQSSVFSEQSLEDPAQRALFKELAAELRCLVCQNQNIADSNATLAQDLRREIHTMISRGDSKSQIIDFMVQRYGEFVLYRPRFSTKTLVLWIGPFLLFAAGLIALWMQARKPRAAVNTDTESLEAARKLLQDNSSDDNKRA